MSDANNTVIRVSGESAFKTLNANPIFQQVRITGASVQFTPENTTSNEINATRQVTDLIQVGFSSGGEIPTEFIVGNLHALYPGAFFNPWNRSPEVIQGYAWEYGWGSANTSRITSITSTTITIAATSVLAGTAVNATGTSFVVGHLIKTFGMGVADQLLRVTASTATSLTVAGATAVASPPSGSRIKVVGFEAVAADVAATITSGNALTSTSLNFTTLGLQVGQWVKIGEGTGAYAFGTAANNGWAKISVIAAQRLDFSVVPSGWAADTGTGKTIRVFFGDTIANGVTQYSYTIEQQLGLTVGTRYQYLYGQTVDSVNIGSESKSVITASVGFQGGNADPFTAVRTTGATTNVPIQGVPLNSSSSIAMIMENGSRVGTPNFVNSFGINLSNNLRPRDAVGVLGPASIGTGRCNVTGSLSTYFGDETYYNKLVNSTVTSLAVGFRDTENFKGEVWDMPRVKYSSGAPDITGIDTDIFAPLEFQALGDPTGSVPYTVQVNVFDYLPA
jgi:hypothetical protein